MGLDIQCRLADGQNQQQCSEAEYQHRQGDEYANAAWQIHVFVPDEKALSITAYRTYPSTRAAATHSHGLWSLRVSRREDKAALRAASISTLQLVYAAE